MKKCVLVFGTRPEAIKLAPVYKELLLRKEKIQPSIWLTGQHLEMLDQVMDSFQIKADRNFSIMKPGQSLTYITTEILSKLSQAFSEDRPDLILVQGDTTTTLAAALAAFYQRIPLGHIEAGLRTSDKHSPFPEEMNRCLTSKLADYHFAHTNHAKENLLREAIPAERIWVTGNTVIDALEYTIKTVRKDRPWLPENFPIRELESGKKMILITGHRRENFGEGFENLCAAISTLAENYREAIFVYPVHLNPKVQEPVFRLLQEKPNIYLTNPLSYPAFVWAMDRSFFLISDSGGIQEEAPHLGKPILVTRETTERPESLQAGTARLVGTNQEVIIREAGKLLEDQAVYNQMSLADNPYGDGHAAIRIADVCCSISQFKI